MALPIAGNRASPKTLRPMTEFKFYNPQTHIPPARLREKLDAARMYVALTREGMDLAFPSQKRIDLEALMVLTCVFIGDAEGRPTTPTKLASHAGLPRASVYRQLEALIRLKKVVRVGPNYRLAPGAAAIDEDGKIGRILRNLPRR